MSDHLERMARLFANAPRGKTAGLNRAERRAAKKHGDRLWKDARKALIADEQSGPGLLVDKELREFLREFNSRAIRDGGPRTLPTSFNVLEAMMRYDGELYIFRLLPERHHLFSWADFIDFVTSSDAPSPRESAYLLEPGTVYEYSAYDDPQDFTFSTVAGREYGIGGVAVVRHDDEISAMMLAGRVGDLDEETKGVKAVDLAEGLPGKGKEHLRPSPDRERRAEPMGDHALWKNVILTRLHVKTMQMQTRYLLTDMGNGFDIATDDVKVIDQRRDDPHVVAAMERMGTTLDENSLLFDLCATTLLLPAYYRFKVTLVRDEGVGATGSGAALPAGKRKKRNREDAGRIRYRSVSALRILNPSRVARRFAPPNYQVQVDGFWRKLDPGSTGRGPDGKPEQGRTWVHAHMRWRDLPAEPPIDVLVKSRIAIARRIAETEALIAAVATAPIESEPKESLPTTASVTREEMYRQRLLMTPRLRWRILQRDQFRCVRCGADAASNPAVKLEVDHVLAVANGGKTEPNNLSTLCSLCNNGKGTTAL